MRSLTRRYFRNANGAVQLSRTCDGVLSHLLESTRQIFQRIPQTDEEEVSSSLSSNNSTLVNALERRARYFERKYEMLLRGSKTHVLLYVESYFDFLRVQSFLKTRLPEEELCCISSGTSSRDCFFVSYISHKLTTHRNGPRGDRKST